MLLDVLMIDEYKRSTVIVEKIRNALASIVGLDNREIYLGHLLQRFDRLRPHDGLKQNQPHVLTPPPSRN